MDTKEKRRNPRFICRVPVLCKKGTMFDNSQTIDISKGGVGFYSQRFVPVDTNMIMEIALSPKKDPLLAVGKVRWIQKVGYMDKYRVGMEFADMSKQAKDRLAEHFDELES